MPSSAQFERVFRGQLEARLLTDLTGTIVQVSKGYLLAHGLPAEDVIGRDLWSLPPLAGDLRAIEQVRALLATSVRAKLPQTVVLMKGAARNTWHSVEVVPVCDDEGTVCYPVITWQRAEPDRPEESARERRLSKLIEHSYDALALFDEKGKTVYASPSFRRMLGLDPEATHDAVALSHVHPDDMVDFATRVGELHHHPGGQFQTRIRVANGQGGYRVIEVKNRNLLADPDVAAIVSHSRDITEDVELHNELMRARERMAVALSAANALSWDLELPTGKSHFSEDLRSYFGVSDEAYVKEGPIAAVHPNSRADMIRLGGVTMSEKSELSVEFRGCDRDGQERWYECLGRALKDAHGNTTHIAGVTWDITEQRKLAQERAVLDQRIRDSQKLESLGVLAGGIAHDFNNLLTAILGHAGLARTYAAGPMLHHLENIEEASQRASDLCRQMLAYAGKTKFVLGVTNLNRLVEGTVHLLKVSISKKVQMSFALAPDLPNIVGDATQLRQVLMNLVINASEAVGEHSGAIAIRTGVRDLKQDDLGQLAGPHLVPGRYAYLEVEDTGSGMSEETRARIFDPFFSTKFTGRGLGLSAVLGIVRGHHGALHVQSTLGRGSCFTMLIPVDPSAVAVAPEPAVAKKAPQYNGTVLVADDEDGVRIVATEMLERLGFKVLGVRDGQAALAAFREHVNTLSLVLMDLTMPRLDGREALLEMRAITSRVPYVILMSGHSEQDAMARFTDIPGVGFLQKPFTPERLQEMIARAWQEQRIRP